MNGGCAEVVTPGLLAGQGITEVAVRRRLRVVLDWTRGAPLARLAGGQGSHMLEAASQAHGYLMIDADRRVEEGHVYGYCPGSQFLD